MCLIVSASQYYVYALAIVKGGGGEELYRRVGMVDWRAPPGIFGWDKGQLKWEEGTKLTTVTII